jgi:alkaline phosphatase D
MSRQIADLIVLAGDIHTSWVNYLKADWRDPNSATIGSEFICTSISSEGDNPATFFEAYLAENPHIKFFDQRHGGYVGVTLTPDLWQGDVKVLQSVTTPGAPLSTAASFVVEAGRPEVQRA